MRIAVASLQNKKGSQGILIAFVLFGLWSLRTLFGARIAQFKGLMKYIPSMLDALFIVLSVYWIPQVHPRGKLLHRGIYVGLAVTGSVILIALRFGAAALSKNLASTSYDISPIGIGNNIVLLLIPLFASIIVRNYVLATVHRKAVRPWLWTALLSILWVLIEFNYVKLSVLRSAKDLFTLSVQDIAPMLAQSFLLSIMCVLGSAQTAMWYCGIERVFSYSFPFLPSLPWLADSFIGILSPIFFAMFLWEEYKILIGDKPQGQKESVVSFAISLAIMVVCSWFIVGVFDVYPTVILTGSMEPEIMPGDVTLVRKFKQESEIYALAVGDVITFKVEDILVTHRITEILCDEAGNLTFHTKGDNNESADTWELGPNDLRGRIIRTVPKIGTPVVLMYQTKPIPGGGTNE